MEDKIIKKLVDLLRRNTAWCDDEKLIEETDSFLDKHFPTLPQ